MTAEIVRCYSGHEYAERPKALYWEGEWLEIEETLNRWQIPGGKRFRVRTKDDQVFELFYGELFDEWRIYRP